MARKKARKSPRRSGSKKRRSTRKSSGGMSASEAKRLMAQLSRIRARLAKASKGGKRRKKEAKKGGSKLFTAELPRGWNEYEAFTPSDDDKYADHGSNNDRDGRRRRKGKKARKGGHRKLSAWTRFVKANASKRKFRYKNGKVNMKALSAAWRKTPAGKASAKRQAMKRAVTGLRDSMRQAKKRAKKRSMRKKARKSPKRKSRRDYGWY